MDDFYVVSADVGWLRSLQQPISDFLIRSLGLAVNAGKTRICDVRLGVEFLGAFLKPHRRYVSSTSLERMKSKIPISENLLSAGQLRSRLNSFLGLLSHYRSYRLRRFLFASLYFVFQHGYYQRGMYKLILYPCSVQPRYGKGDWY